MTIPGDDPFAVRDRALFELAYSSGLRLSELAGLDLVAERELQRYIDQTQRRSRLLTL